MSNIADIADKKKKKHQAEKDARDILKPKCDEELSEEEYPEIKEDD